MAEPRRNLSVELRVVNFPDPHPTRTFILKSPTYAIRIGRGSKSGNRELFPSSHNAWFDSRVMSREHAVLKADPDYRSVYIEDVGSMHGTYVDDRRVVAHERHPLYDDSLVKFGSEVTRGPGMCFANDEPAPFCSEQPIRWLPVVDQIGRGSRSNIADLPESFPPLHVALRFTWVDDSFGRHLSAPGLPHARLTFPPNTFRVPDYDDEEDEDDDDISFVQETVLNPKVEPVPTPSYGSQNAIQPYSQDADSEMPEQSAVDVTGSAVAPPLSGIPSTAAAQMNDSMVETSSTVVNNSVATPAPSSIDEAGRSGDDQPVRSEENSNSSPDTSPPTDIQSPAKSSLPTSSQTKESEAQVYTKDKIRFYQPESGRFVGTKKRAMIIDEDLTQSESESEAPYSPDLMIDDSEDEQKENVLSGYESDFDEEAWLVAENNGRKPTRIEDSTESESSRSDLSDDIGLEREEDFFVDSTSKVAAMKDDGPNKIDCEKELTEPETVPYNMRPGNFTMPSTRLNVPSNPLHRAPSPSDAAMAKPCEFAPSTAGFPNDPYASYHPQTWPSQAASFTSAWPFAFDARQHDPYEDRLGDYQYPYASVHPLAQFSADHQRAFPPPTAGKVVNERILIPDIHTVREPERLGAIEKSQPQLTFIPKPCTSSHLNIAHPTLTQQQAVAKVSIDSIVERVSGDSPSSANGSTLKRKADGMTVDATESAHGSTTQAVEVENTLLSAESVKSSGPIMAEVERAQEMSSNREIRGERPAKRARVGQATQKTSFGTLAATALAGAVVGGVGVVAALVSLPPDFFV